MNLVGSINRITGAVLLTICLALASISSVQAAECKGLSKTKCEASDSCSWIKGYKTKTGSSVNAYCRAKAGKSTKKKSEKEKAKK